MSACVVLSAFYRRLFNAFGPQHWWPAETDFEVMVGAILTQSTSWANVEKALDNLKKKRLLDARKLRGLSHKRLASLIRSAGYYNIKARRLKSFLDFFFNRYGASIRRMKATGERRLRQELLGINGVGQETADSILLYALGKPVFVVDAYTKRILGRHGMIAADSDYSQVQDLFTTSLKKDAKLFNEFHALLVRLGKEYCLKKRPKCKDCPLRGFPEHEKQKQA